jgi:hypothetical protein
MIKFRGSVITPKVVIIVAAVANAAAELRLPGDIYVTSGNDGQHMPGSKHYTDEALDFRSRHLTAEQQAAWVLAIRRRLGSHYDVVLEHNPEHLHVEYDPLEGHVGPPPEVI